MVVLSLYYHTRQPSVSHICKFPFRLLILLNITLDTLFVSTYLHRFAVGYVKLKFRPVTLMLDEIDGFENLSLKMNRNVRNARFSATLIIPSLPDLESLLVFPPFSGSIANQARLRQIAQNAF